MINWLASRPNPPAVNGKEQAWSHMAGWYADHGCETFLEHLWNDAKIADELIRRLVANNAWKTIQALAG